MKDVILLGCSQGGVEALGRLLPALRPSSPPVVVVIHLPSNAETLLPELYRDRCQVLLKEIEDKQILESGTVYFAPPNYHVLLEPDASVSLSIDDPVLYSRPSIDLLFESAAYSIGKRATGVLLTGANADGAQGLKKMKDHGSFCVVQDPKTAEAPTMPNAALDLFKPDLVGDLARIGDWLKTLTTTGASRESS